jgi:pyruvate dehydrogenase E2 component (dihydrolipoamide acetyltransferase)
MRDVVMPTDGMAMESGLLLQWLVQPGEPVAEGDTIAEIETDKAVVALASPAAGRLGDHLVPEDTEVPVGTVLTRIVEEGDDG